MKPSRGAERTPSKSTGKVPEWMATVLSRRELDPSDDPVADLEWGMLEAL